VTAASARVAAQAKLNLHLRVLSREATGYHSIETIFHRIDLADDVVVSITDGERTIDVVGAETGPAESNLAFRAAALYASQAGWPAGFRIELEKRIPVGAGLGGGSADAAAVLRALNFLSPRPLPVQGLLELASQLGADVPFLASGAVMALAWGRGERMLECAPLPRRDILLMTPGFSVATADAYRWLDEDRLSETGEDIAAGNAPLLIDPLALTTWDAIAGFARNDFERVVAARHPRLEGYLEALRRSRASIAQMTGSGSMIFGVLDSPAQFAKIPEEHRGSVTTTKTSIDVVQPISAG
jgi:4-diphosphocytidyl-2-C-methyl-D-erythritol kinase